MDWLLDGIFLGEMNIFQAYTGKFPYFRESLAESFRVKCRLFQMIQGRRGCVCMHTYTRTHISVQVESEPWGLVGGMQMFIGSSFTAFVRCRFSVSRCFSSIQ